jgi:hypothetical protein
MNQVKPAGLSQPLPRLRHYPVPGRRLMKAARRQVATISPRWLNA